MKKAIYFIILISLLNCSKKIDAGDSPDLVSDIVYTDSFSPSSYETPLSRKVVTPEDIDIKAIISPDTSDPDLRSVYSFISNLFFQIYSKSSVRDFFSSSAYNSYRLRYASAKVPVGKYELRVSKPEIFGQEPFRINYKIMAKDNVFIGEFELTPDEGSFFISDFESKGLDELFNVK